MSIAVVTAWDSALSAVGQAVWPNRQAYCARHGYALLGGPQPGAAGPWMKPPLLRDALDAGHDLAVWLDADLWITAPAVTLEGLWAAHADGGNLLASFDLNGLNTGALFWDRSPWSLHMLRAWAGDGRRYAGWPLPEQTALAYLLYREPQCRWSCVGQKHFNAFDYGLYGYGPHPAGQWSPGDFALHLAGVPDARRLEVFAILAREERLCGPAAAGGPANGLPPV